MAMTVKASPQKLTPAYNPIKFIYDSTNKNLPGFKYIFQVFEGGTANQIAEYRVLPVYSTGYGLIDLSRLLQSQVSYDFEPTNTTVYDATNSHYKYDVKIGEEYLTTTTFTSAMTQYVTAPYAGTVQLNGANTFAVGDQIVVTQTGAGVANANLDGLYTVLVATPTYIVINFLWSSITNAGKDVEVTYADGRKTTTYAIVSALNYYVFNGAMPWVDFPTWDMNEYYLTNITDKFLTTCPDTFYCTLSEDLWMNAVYGGPGPGTHKIIFKNDAGEIFEKSVLATDHVTGNAVGPNNHGVLTPIVGVLPLIKPTTESYTYYYEHNGNQVTQPYTVMIDRRVRMEEITIAFLDRFGSWGSFAFTGRIYERGTVQREQYNMDVQGYINSTPEWTYYTTDRGYINSYVSVDNTIDLSTDWMNETDAAYFTELISSPYTYFKRSNYYESCDIPASSEYISCNIVTSTFEKYKQRNKNLIKQSITIRLANNDIVNG